MTDAVRFDFLHLKRLIDVTVGTTALIVFTPVLLMSALFIIVDSPGNPFFMQLRVGRKGKLFKIIKFRTLFIDQFGIVLDEELVNPKRITKLGKYLRRSKLDELPQLINVISGRMSLVGPRPDIIEQVINYNDNQRERLSVKPGLTGVTQISGNNILPWSHRFWLDRWYIKNWTLGLDFKIMFCTIHAILKGETLKTDPLKLHHMIPSESQN